MKALLNKLLIAIIVITLFLSGCSIKEEDQQKNITTSSIISPQIKVKDQYYRGVLPYKTSPINGILSRIPYRLDSEYFELGLLELAKKIYDPASYIFQEGQFLTMEEITPLTSKEKYPQFADFVYAVTEHNYLREDGKLGGIVIGLLVSPKYDVLDEQGEYVRNSLDQRVSKFYSDEELVEKTKELVREINQKVKSKVRVPVFIGAMKAETVDLKVPGTFFLTGNSPGDKSQIEDWNTIDEVYLFLPSALNIEDKYYNYVRVFNLFKEVMDEYLVGYAGITGLARIVNGELYEIKIKAYTKFDSTVETVQYVQFAAAMIDKYFPEGSAVNLYVYSIDRPRAIYVKTTNAEGFMHIFKD